jgi:Ca-activated chloride channel family protein
VNAGKHKILLNITLVLLLFQIAFADSAQVSTGKGNRLYEQEKFDEAIKQYDEALIRSPEVIEPKFNKANSYYRLDDLKEAMSLYRQVAAESKDMKLVTKAKYNLGNCSFQQGSKQKDSNLQKAIEDMETAIGNWRGVLDLEPENQKAAKNIEVARLTIKDILDQLKNQQEQQDPNQPQDPNQSQQQQQNQQQSQQQSSEQSQDQQQQQASKEEPNQPQEEESEEQSQQKQQDGEQQAPDTTAQEILDKEQRDKKQRQMLQRARYQKVEKDW